MRGLTLTACLLAAFATPAQAITPQTTADLDVEEAVASYEATRDCPWPDDFLPDGQRNLDPSASSTGANLVNALYQVQRHYGGYDGYQAEWERRHGSLDGIPRERKRYDPEFQRFGADCILRGLVIARHGGLTAKGPDGRSASAHIARGLKVFDHALARLADDNTFVATLLQTTDLDRRAKALTHETAWFLAVWSRALYDLRDSGYYAAEVDARRATLLGMARALLYRAKDDTQDADLAGSRRRGSSWAVAVTRDDDYAHRFFLKGSALAFSAKLNGLSITGTSTLAAKAREQVVGGQKRQIGEGGANPDADPRDWKSFQEKRHPDGSPGTDTGYHATSLDLAEKFLLHFPSYHDASELRIRLNRGREWLVAHVEQASGEPEDGWIDHERNTRTCAGELNTSGAEKEPHYEATVWVFEGRGLHDLASRVDGYLRRYRSIPDVSTLCDDPR